MTRLPADKNSAALYRDGISWGQDRLSQLERSQRLAYIMASVSTVVAVLATSALVLLTPLKTVVPYTILVDRQTGHVTTLNPSRAEQIDPEGALAKSMLVQYVVARETADRSSVRDAYRKVVLWSDGTARASYLVRMQPGNPDNPLVQTSSTSTIQTLVKSVSMLEKGSALVRFDLVRRDETGVQGATASYVAIMRYRFRDRPLAEADRYINPLGFEVINYQRNAEVIAPVSTPVQIGTLQQNSAVALMPQSDDTRR